MPLRNRATPQQEIIADPARGLVYANRGVLVDAHGEIRRRWGVRRWIACRLEFKGRRRRPLMAPGRYTELFFLDEATAFAAGHRPCGECRYEDYQRFSAIWQQLHPGQVGADAMDDQLHSERVDPQTRGQRHHEMPWADLPDGAFVSEDERPVAGPGRPTTGMDSGRLRRRPPDTPVHGHRCGDHTTLADRGAAVRVGARDRPVPAPHRVQLMRMHAVVAWAMSLPVACTVSRPSAVASRRPACTTVPSAMTRPVSTVIPRA